MKQDFNKSNPHAHSAPFTVDPAYCVAKKLPESEGLSLCSESPPGACWLYLSGDIAAHLFNRMRREAFSVCKNVFHPGEFRNFRPTLYARRMLSLPALPGKAVVRFFCSGQATLKINGMTLFSLAFPARPEACEIDFLPYLKTGDNEIVLVVQSLGEPPALLAQGDFLETDARWVVSSDAVNWYRPDCMPCAGLERFPHQENLPELILTAKSMGDGLYDFGTETFGRPLVSVQGHGALTMHVGESVPEALATAVHAGEQFIPPLVRSGGTYACETNLALRYIHLVHPPDLRVEAVKLAAVLYPARYKGAFACSDDTLTDIWMRAAYTLRLCMRWLCVDGLKRDRLPWGGDLYMSGLVNNYSFHDKGLMQRSLMGLYGEGPETMDVNGIVDYSFFWVIALRDHHMHFGDTLFLDQLRPLLQRLLKSFAARCDSTGCIPTRKGEWVFIDWSEVEKSGYSSCIQMLHVMALDAAADLYGAMGDATQASALRSKAATLRRLCDKLFWSETACAYADNVVDGRQGEHRSRPPNILAVLSGTAGLRKMRMLVKNIFTNDAVKAVGTPYMRAFEALALSRCWEGAAMLSIIREDWGGMVKAGATTFWEGYDKSQTELEQYSFYGRPFGKSLCHAWSAGPVYLLSNALTGARPLAPGWSRFTISPEIAGLQWATVSIPCPQGAILIEMEKRSASVTVPEGCVLVEKTGKSGQREHQGPCRVTLKANKGN